MVDSAILGCDESTLTLHFLTDLHQVWRDFYNIDKEHICEIQNWKFCQGGIQNGSGRHLGYRKAIWTTFTKLCEFVVILKSNIIAGIGKCSVTIIKIAVATILNCGNFMHILDQLSELH